MKQVINSFRSIRCLSTKRKLAVIGSGPSAFYTVLNILKNHSNDIEIDMFEQNPSPFGLVRYGVAPDHPEVKNCIDRFNDIQEYMPMGSFKYFGNIGISNLKNKNNEISLKDLYKNYNGVLYAYGSSNANLPEISGLNHPGVIDSYKFVNWYNGHPNFQNLNIPLNKIKNVSIIGNGNVAIDITRILLAPSDKHWQNTDISNNALKILNKSNVKNINIIARRGLIDSKFTNKELRELLELENYGVYFSGYNKDDFKDQLNDLKLDRINKRRISLLDKYNNKYSNEELANGKTWNLQYLKNPIGVKVLDDELLSETIFTINKIEKEKESGDWKIKPSGQLTSVKNELLILATGYKCEPLSEFKELGIPFSNGHIINEDGKINHKLNSYCVGWVSNGSRGNINSTVIDSSNVSNTIINDILKNTDEKLGRIGIEKILKDKNIKPITWNDWNKIHTKEIENGKLQGKPYEKMKFEDMIKYVS
jgi:adrenodoxin-NADP+ reductase